MEQVNVHEWFDLERIVIVVVFGVVCILCVATSKSGHGRVGAIGGAVRLLVLVLDPPLPVPLTSSLRQEMTREFHMQVEQRWLDAYSEASGFCAGYFIERAAAVRVLSGIVE
jgi:hypothetical protein